jgi:hypothetical protein
MIIINVDLLNVVEYAWNWKVYTYHNRHTCMSVKLFLIQRNITTWV